MEPRETTEPMGKGIHAAAERALDDVRPALAPDGFSLHLQSVHRDGTVNVVPEAQADACGECLVPDEMLIEIIEAALRDRGAGFRRVALARNGL